MALRPAALSFRFSSIPLTTVGWLLLAAGVGTMLIFFYPDSYQQDAGIHYTFSRWAMQHPKTLVSVWGRPLFTSLYYLPAQFGYQSAKFFALFISLATAWQTWRLAQQLRMDRTSLTIPFLFLQPSFLLICTDTMTEPLMALVLTLALRLHLSGRLIAGMVSASLMPLARPEGFFLCLLWGAWILLDKKHNDAWAKHLRRVVPSTLWLATGVAVWWLAALLLMRDPLWIKHNWPLDWRQNGLFGTGPLWWYLSQSSYVIGVLLRIPFALGFALLLWQKKLIHITTAFLTIFVLHSVMYWRGSFSSAGYPRYFVCIAPLMAIIALTGWNAIADVLGKVSRPALAAVAATGLLLSSAHALHYVDGWGFSRDAWAVNEMYAWFQQHAARTHPVKKLVSSQTYFWILLDVDPWDNPVIEEGAAYTHSALQAAPPGTLVLWDKLVGEARTGFTQQEFAAAGFVPLHKQSFHYGGRFFNEVWKKHGYEWHQEMYLLYKPFTPSEDAEVTKTNQTTLRQN
jgi:hypothetical protein